MKTRIEPGRAAGTVLAPPSKSYAHRLLICAALSKGVSTIYDISKSEDILATLDCISALGASCKIKGDAVTIRGTGSGCPDVAMFPCRESGSTLRFFIPLALVGGKTACFTGSYRLMERGIGVYEDLLRQKGFTIQKSPELIMISGALTPGEYTLPGDVSSQFVSGLLFALPLLGGRSMIKVLPPVESRAYIDITIDVLKRFGVLVTKTEHNTFSVQGGQSYNSTDVTVEGDWSNAAFLYAFNSIGGDVKVTGLNQNSIQGDRSCLGLFRKLEKPGAVIDISGCPDLGPVLFAVAAAKNGAVFNGTKRLRIKESDRAQAMAEELNKFGIHIRIYDNRMFIHNDNLRKPTNELNGHNDHRIVMALSFLASITGGVIDGTEAVQKSYPDFFAVLRSLGLEVKHEIG